MITAKYVILFFHIIFLLNMTFEYHKLPKWLHWLSTFFSFITPNSQSSKTLYFVNIRQSQNQTHMREALATTNVLLNIEIN